jgi:hypothetical protein
VPRRPSGHRQQPNRRTFRRGRRPGARLEPVWAISMMRAIAWTPQPGTSS